MKSFTQSDYDALASLVFRSDYPGYRPTVVEAPAGNAAARDSGKRYAHVAIKYLLQLARPLPEYDNFPADGGLALYRFLVSAHHEAEHVANRIAVPAAFRPSFEHGALRVLEYPANVGGHVHTDFDLFSVNLWRSCPNPGLAGIGGRQYHMGEIGELVGLGKAEPHHVNPLPVPQLSLVYFAIPEHSAVLPYGFTVGEWINERINRSRYAAK